MTEGIGTSLNWNRQTVGVVRHAQASSGGVPQLDQLGQFIDSETLLRHGWLFLFSRPVPYSLPPSSPAPNLEHPQPHLNPPQWTTSSASLNKHWWALFLTEPSPVPRPTTNLLVHSPPACLDCTGGWCYVFCLGWGMNRALFRTQG